MDPVHHAAIQTDCSKRIVIRLEGTVRAHAAEAWHLADAGAAAVALRADVAAGHHHFARPVKHVFHFEILAGEGADLLFGFFRSLGNNRNAADRRGGGDNGSGLE